MNEPVAIAYAVKAMYLVLLLSLEGLFRGQFLRVVVRMIVAAALLVGLYYLVVDWRIVSSWVLLGAAVLLLVANLRDSLRR